MRVGPMSLLDLKPIQLPNEIEASGCRDQASG